MDNPFKKKGAGNVREAGEVEVVLDEIAEFEQKNHPKSDNPDGTHTALIFKFLTLDAEPDTVSWLGRASNHKKSKMLPFVAQMNGGDIPKDIAEDAEHFWTLVQNMKGRKFKVYCEPSWDGRYNNIAENAMGLPLITPLETVTKRPEATTVADDEVPF